MAYYKTFTDSAFASGDSPVVHDIAGGLGRKSRSGYIRNYGSGALTFAISVDGTSYGEEVTLPGNTTHFFQKYYKDANGANVEISKIRVTHVADTSYTIYAD